MERTHAESPADSFSQGDGTEGLERARQLEFEGQSTRERAA